MKLHVITPIGPGHDQLKNRALESVRIAMEADMGPFADVRLRAIDDTEGKMGRSAARNMAVQSSDADWIFFLDADDVMHPWALLNVENYIEDFDAIWGEISELVDGCILPRYQVPDLLDIEDILKYDPYLTLQMGHFVRIEVARDNPFDESMDTGEDWDYYLRVWRQYHCKKIPYPLMVNSRGQHSIGPRSADGAQWRVVVEQLLDEARGARKTATG
jgi:glycosyltransferase involved in cell wall biosynthesis